MVFNPCLPFSSKKLNGLISEVKYEINNKEVIMVNPYHFKSSGESAGEKAWGCITSLFMLSLSTALFLYKAFVLSVLWTWFLIPLGVAGLTFWHSAGICVIIGLVTIQINKTSITEESGSTEFLKLVSYGMTYSFALLSGYIYHYYMILK